MGLDQLAQTVPWLAIALGAVVLSTVLVRARLAIYVCFVGALAFGAYREQSWVLAAFATAISLLLLVEERFPRHPNAGTQREMLHSTIYALCKRACGPVAAVVLLNAGAGKLDHSLGLADTVPLWGQALIALAVLDFKQYWIHRGQHRFGVWWKFHRVHHYAEHLNVLAHGRTHLLEFIVIQICSTMLIVRLLGLSPEAVLYGYALPGLAFAAMWAHANIDFPRRRLPWLATLVTSPNAHALHHTKRDDQRNFGEILLVWDRLFGTYQCPVTARDQLGDYGVAGHVPSHSVWREQLMLEREPARAAAARLAG